MWARCKWDGKVRGFLIEKVNCFASPLRNRSLSCFSFAIKGEKGLSAPAIKNKLALRVSVTGSIFLDGVKVKHDAILNSGSGSAGLGAPFSCLNNARCAALARFLDCNEPS